MQMSFISLSSLACCPSSQAAHERRVHFPPHSAGRQSPLSTRDLFLLQLVCYSKNLGIALISVSAKGFLEQWNEKSGQRLCHPSVARIGYTLATPIPSRGV